MTLGQNINWTFRGNYDDPRLTEIKSLYEQLGFSVRLTPILEDKARGCKKCFTEDAAGRFCALYTKKIDSEL